MNGVSSNATERLIDWLQQPLPGVDPATYVNPWSDEPIEDDDKLGLSGEIRRRALREFLDVADPPRIIVIGRDNGLWGTRFTGLPLIDSRVLSMGGISRVQPFGNFDSTPPNPASTSLWLELRKHFAAREVMTWSVQPMTFRRTGKDNSIRRLIPTQAPDEVLELGEFGVTSLLSEFPDSPILVLGTLPGELVKKWAPPGRENIWVDGDFDLLGKLRDDLMYSKNSPAVLAMQRIAEMFGDQRAADTLGATLG